MFHRTPVWAKTLLLQGQQILKGINTIMAAVQIEQQKLDDTASALEGLVTAVNGLPKGVLPPANETALQTAVTDLQTAVGAVVAADTPPPTV